MRTRIMTIGNSLGVRIPKSLLEQTGLSAKKPRNGWETGSWTYVSNLLNER